MFTLEFSKWHKSVKTVGVKLRFLIFAHCLMMLYNAQSFLKTLQSVLESSSGHEIMTDGRTDRQIDVRAG